MAAGKNGCHAIDLIRQDTGICFLKEAEVSPKCISALHPLLVGCAEKDRAVEAARPVGPCGIVVWVGDNDGFDAAQLVDL